MASKLGQPTAKLHTGAKIPLVGLGTWKSEPGKVKEAVSAALRAGYRHIDCAEVYGNEHEAGQALKEALDQGVVAREDLWVTSKLWNKDHGNVEKALRKTLDALNVDYLNLYLIHWPIAGNVGPTVEPSLEATWHDMEKMVDAGLTRHIGVSNYSIKKLGEVLEYARIKPAVLQIEAHPYWRNDALIAFAHGHGVHVTAYSPLGSAQKDDAPSLMQDEKVKEIAEKLGKDKGQVLLRWGLQHGTSIIPKSTNPDRIKSNLEGALGWELPQEDYEALCRLRVQQRMVPADMFLNPKGPYKTAAEVWDEPAGECQGK